MNDMKKIKFFVSPLLASGILFFLGCENPKLKQPRESSSEQTEGKSDHSDQVDQEFTRELAREFAREFVQEFAKQMNQKGFVLDANKSLKMSDNPSLKTGLLDANGKPHPLLSHCSEDVLEFSEIPPGCS